MNKSPVLYLRFRLLWLLFLLSAAQPATLLAGEARVTGGITATYLGADDNRVEEEGLLSLDFAADIPVGPGTLTLHLEGSSTPRNAGIATLIDGSNADAGSALDENGKARFQVSELLYTLPFREGQLTLGLLMDVTAFLDGGEIANDENAQFLSATLVNNPTIGFPDYAPGIAFHLEQNGNRPGFTLLVASSHGLADNDASYSKTFHVDDGGKGVFGAAEFRWPVADMQLATGLWLNSARHDELDGSGTDRNYGLYGVLQGNFGNGAWLLRAGVANKEVSEAAWFLSAALEQSLSDQWALGAGLAHTAASSELGSGYDDNLHGEIYARYHINEHVHVTPLLQYVRNPGFDGSGSTVDGRVLVYGLRLHAGF